MARSSDLDAIEKFRFNVFVFNTTFDPAALIQNFTGFLRAGFSEVTLPRQNTGSIEYRENIDPTHPQQVAGITRYEPVILRRGVTNSSDFFRWAKDVHNSSVVATTGILRLKSGELPPSEVSAYRRDIMIVSYGRGGAQQVEEPTGTVNRLINVAGAATSGFGLTPLGDVKKAWLLRDAWVSSYKPGDDLSASGDDSKLIEEVEVKYESFDEISLEAILSQAADLALGVI